MTAYQELMDEIRESRRRMSQGCNHDPGKYVAYLKSFNARYSKQVALFQKVREPVPDLAVEDRASSPE